MVLKAFAGIQLPDRGAAKVLRNRPPIAEIEAMIENRSIEWSPIFKEKCDAASLALFGVTEDQTRPPEPHPDDIKDEGPMAWYRFGDDAFATYGAKLNAWYQFMSCTSGFDQEVSERGAVAYWRRRGYDVTDGYGEELRCLPRFQRQLYIALHGLLPGARVTLDGTGKRPPQSAEEWGASLAAEAARFKPTR